LANLAVEEVQAAVEEWRLANLVVEEVQAAVAK
jgi:hypothetical protein